MNPFHAVAAPCCLIHVSRKNALFQWAWLQWWWGLSPSTAWLSPESLLNEAGDLASLKQSKAPPH